MLIGQILILFVIFLVCTVFLKEFGNWLNKKGYNEMADSVHELSKQFQAKQNEIMAEGKRNINSLLTPEKIQSLITGGFHTLVGSINQDSFNKSGYAYIITEDKDHPFQITKEIAQVAEQLTKGISDNLEKAKTIFNWFHSNIPYDYEQCRKINSNQKVTYRNSREVWQDKQGVCGEMAVLLIVMMRQVGISARYVCVSVDDKNQTVRHACACITCNGTNYLSDPAYHSFDVKHKKFEVLTDIEAIPHLKSMRN